MWDFVLMMGYGLRDALTDHTLAVLAFLMRLGSLVFTLLLYHFFRGVVGPLVQAFRTVFACLAFLLAWFTVASVLELLGFVPAAGSGAEWSYAFVFIPNCVVMIALCRLYLRVRAGAPDYYGR